MSKSTFSTCFSFNSRLHFFLRRHFFLLVLVLQFFSFEVSAVTKYVSKGGSGLKTGTNWSNALDGTGDNLKRIIEGSQNGDLIYISGGVYSVSSTIQWNNNVSIFGGFDSMSPESSPAQRQNNIPLTLSWIFPSTAQTIIQSSGCGGFRIIKQTNDYMASLDGVIIQNGNAGCGNGGGVLLT